MVQPTRIVCCAFTALALATMEAAAPAAMTHFETIRICPLRFYRACEARSHVAPKPEPFMVQMIRQAIGCAEGFARYRLICGAWRITLLGLRDDRRSGNDRSSRGGRTAN